MSESYKQLLQAAEDAAALMALLRDLPMSISVAVKVDDVTERLRMAIRVAQGEQS